MRTYVIADDLTGAAEIAGVAHRLGCRVRLTTTVDALRAEDEVVVLATDTRSMGRAEALAYTEEVVRQLATLERPDRLFKKTDSVLRGHVVAELEALWPLGYRQAMLLPANPSKERLIVRRRYTIAGTPLNHTLFRHDPEFPATTSDVVKLLGDGIPYITTRTRRVQLPEGISIGEVASQEDLERHVARFDAPATIWAGGADLFETLMIRHGKAHQAHAPFAGMGTRRALIVLGSTARHNLFEEPFFARNRVAVSPMPDTVFEGGTTDAWIAESLQLAGEADSLLLRIPQQITHDEGKALQLRHQMAEAVTRLIAELRPDEVIIEGGATAYTILARLAWSDLRIADEIAPGVVRLCHAESGTHLTFKPGSYPWGACFQ
ncbi:MAG: hypothetical protein IIU94_00405 [Alistipes sp.]|nr:hypothetical protein [Alistipes sp.]